MMKFKTSSTTYKVHGEKTGLDYLVTMQRLKNTPTGNPRFKALVTPLVPYGYEPNGIEYFTYEFLVHGHYYDERTEAQIIVNKMLDKEYKEG